MRVVELDKGSKGRLASIALVTGSVSAFISIQIIVMLAISNFKLRASNPMNSPELASLYKLLESNKQDETLKEAIRAMDELARRAYFTSEDFIDWGVYVLFVCSILSVLSLKYVIQLKKAPPYPDSSDPTRDLKAEGMQWRKSFTMGGLAVVAFVLAIVIPWESAIDSPSYAEMLAGDTKGPASKGSMSGAMTAELAANMPPVPVASREEHLKNWSTFLGVDHSRVSGIEPPSSWSMEDNVMWSAPTPLPGFNSPVLWGNQLFFAGGSETKREIYCYDIQHGGELWRHKVTDIPGSPAEPPYVQADTGFAASTMVTDGTQLYAIFATGDLVAVDFKGKRVWGRNVGVPDNPYGHASSLVIYESTLLVQYDQNDQGHLWGVDLRNGEELWSVERAIGASWSTPLLIEHEGEPQVVLSAPGKVVSYDPRDGKELWSCPALDHSEVASRPAYADGKIFVSADGSQTYAIDVTTHEVLWENLDDLAGVSSPMVAAGLLIVPGAGGGIGAIDINSGEEIWYEDTDDGFYASPVLAGENIYLIDRLGLMRIFKPGPTYDEVAQIELGEEVVCTPLFVGKSMYLRGVENLYRIGK